jgi:hypothetical protein
MMMKKINIAFLTACMMFFPLCSCTTGEMAAAAAAQILGASSQAPLFLSCKAVSENEIDFEFSHPVKVVSLRFSPGHEIASMEEGSTVRVRLEENLGPAQPLKADLLAEDTKGNTINVLVPFRSRNNRVPQMLINELRTENSKLKSEYIEFRMLSAGNLGALRVFVTGNYKNPMTYEFPPAEVKTGEYVVLHLRTPEELCKDELSGNLNESGGTDASARARDFWIPGSSKLLHKTDAVYVLDQDDRVLSAVMMSETPDASWKKDYFAEAAEFLFKQGAWKSAGGKICAPKDAVDTSGVKTAATRSISRDETVKNTNTAADWYVTATSCATPGEPNNPKRN